MGFNRPALTWRQELLSGYHPVEALLCGVFEPQELAVTGIYEDTIQVPELPPDRGEHYAEVGEVADVCANGDTSGSKRLLSPCCDPSFQPQMATHPPPEIKHVSQCFDYQRDRSVASNFW